MELNIIHNEDCRTGLQRYPDNFFHCCVTSPPYWGLRDYGVAGQMGLEETPELFIENMVRAFREVKRVLRDDGTLWINIGDSYAASAMTAHNGQRATRDQEAMSGIKRRPSGGMKPKDLVGIPWMLAFALRADGWYLRQDIIWHKPNPMPESAQDRCTKAHEYLFLLTKSKQYYYNAYAIATPYADKTYTTFGIDHKSSGLGDGTGLIASENWNSTIKTRQPKQWKTPDNWDTGTGTHGAFHRNGREKGRKPRPGVDEKGGNQGNGDIPTNDRANKRSVWTIATQPFKDAHFATFPEELPHTCILAGCPEGGNVLDPFMGAGTTGLVARKLQRNYVGFELNPEYIAIAERRLRNDLGMFL